MTFIVKDIEVSDLDLLVGVHPNVSRRSPLRLSASLLMLWAAALPETVA